MHKFARIRFSNQNNPKTPMSSGTQLIFSLYVCLPSKRLLVPFYVNNSLIKRLSKLAPLKGNGQTLEETTKSDYPTLQ